MKEDDFVYQIFPQTFYDGNSKGKGNIKGIIKKLDYLKWLGITKIWITPFYLSDFKDSGYDVIDYYLVDPSMGTIEDFKQLIVECDKRNISVIIDIVFNHTSSKHFWFQEAIKGNKKYQDYYIFKSSDKLPNNWKSKMGGSCWEYVKSIDKYYLHLFAKDQPDLNWENKEVKQELIKILNFWIDLDVKGFRFDVCNLYSKPNIWEDDLIGDGRKFYTDGPKIGEYFSYMNKNSFGKIKDFFTVGELSSTTKEKAIEYTKAANAGLDLAFTFHHLKVDYKNNNKWTYMKPDLEQFYSIIKEWQYYFQEHKGNLSLFLNNHDQPRSISRFANDKNYHYQSATSIALFMYMLKGVPFIFQGEEIGMTNYIFNNLKEFWDVETVGNLNSLRSGNINDQEILNIARTKARENSRTVMQWENTINAEFTSINTNLKINKNYKTINVLDQLKNKKSILWFYKQIIELRKTIKALNSGTIKFLDNKNNLFSYYREYGNDKYLIVTNWTEDKIKNPFHKLTFEIILNNYDSFEHKILPYQAILLKVV